MMRRFGSGLGIDQGSRILFADFADDGAMWTGTGPREVRQHQRFSQPFQEPPVVTVSISMWDIAHQTNSRVDITSDAITETGFDIVFRTLGDSRIARIRAEWMAIGPLSDDELWDVP